MNLDRLDAIATTYCKESFTREPTLPINRLRGFMKSINLLLVSGAISKDTKFQQLAKVFSDLYEVTKRNHLYTPQGLLERRRKAELCINGLEAFREHFSPQDFDDIINTLTYIKLENWTKQLQRPSGVISNAHLKKELYLNAMSDPTVTVLEPREYIGIDPCADSDLDAPSVVTAMTPPRYTQPIHSHDQTTEITFYTGNSKAIFFDNGEPNEIYVSFGDVVIIPPKITHTIQNPTDNPVQNISVKLPIALTDRQKRMQYNNAKGIEVRGMQAVNGLPGVYSIDIHDLEVGYKIDIYTFSESQTDHIIKPRGKSMIYVIKGGLTVQFLGKDAPEGELDVVKDGDVIIANDDTPVLIHSIKKDCLLYMVTLDHHRSLSESNERILVP